MELLICMGLCYSGGYPSDVNRYFGICGANTEKNSSFNCYSAFHLIEAVRINIFKTFGSMAYK